MLEDNVRLLMRDSATDEVLGPPGINLDSVIGSGRRTVRVRRVVVGALAVGVAGTALAVPLLLSSSGGPGPASPPLEFGAGGPGQAASTGPGSPDGGIISVVQAAIPGASVKVGQRRGKSYLDGTYSRDGKKLAVISLTAYKGDGTAGDVNPCVLGPGETAGRQGAPAPDDTCTSAAQPDGTTVWFWRKGHSASRSWTTDDTRDWEASYRRADGIVVNLTISNATGATGTTYLTPKFDIPDAAMVSVVTAPQVRALVG
jgi:hypothetical protein